MQHIKTLFVDSVYKKFGERNVLNGVHFQCNTNEVLGILGRNGSGKSTLLKIVFGLVSSDHFYGRIDETYFSKGYLDQKIAYLPQDGVFPRHFSVKKAIRLWGAPAGISEFWANPVIQEILDRRIGHLSGGQQRFLEVMLVLYGPAAFVMLDEPFSNIAPILVDALKSEISKVKTMKGIILTDHYFRDVISISDRIVLLHNGSNYKISTTEDLITHGYMREQMLDF